MFEKLGASIKVLDNSKQLIIVHAKKRNSFKAECSLYEKKENSWIEVKKFPVVIGENGFRWGKGLHQAALPEKIEGDGCSPAGIFYLGTAFGDFKMINKATWPYKVVNQNDIFVDDISSKFYNSFQKKSYHKIDWNSFEEMKRSDGLYNKAIVIKHNMNPVITKKGSAIFFHIWRSEKSHTRGCTAMEKTNIKYLIAWLDKEKNPLLVQLPSNIPI